MAGGAGLVVCWVGSTFYRWDLPLHASLARVAFRVLSSILGKNASTATIWWPFSGNTDAFHFKPVGRGRPAVPPQSSTLCFKWLFVYLCRHNLEAFSVCCDITPDITPLGCYLDITPLGCYHLVLVTAI